MNPVSREKYIWHQNKSQIYDKSSVHDSNIILGDKSSVTVMGHGTGAACLHYLMTSDALPHGE